MKYLIILIFYLITYQGYCQCLKADIIIVGDLSGSVIGYELEVQRAFKSFVDRFELHDETIRIGLVVFAENHFTISKLTFNKNQLYGAIKYMFGYPVGINTDVGSAMEAAYYELFEDRIGDDVRKIMITITDGGINMNKDKFVEIVTQIKNTPDMTSCGILIDNGITFEENLLYLSDDYCYVASDYESLQKTLERLTICL